jgi:hypothetical protein
MKNLKWLTVNFEGATQPKLPLLPRLEYLEIRGTVVSDQLLPLAGQFPSLKYLVLSESSVTDVGISQLVNDYPNLVALDLGSCREVTYDSVSSLEKLLKLRFLDVRYTKLELQLRPLIYGTIPELQIKLPECKIEFEQHPVAPIGGISN